jgi:hypothetical protein
VYLRDEMIARRYDPLDHLTYSRRGLDQFHLYLVRPVIRIFMIHFMLAAEFLGYYTDIEYLFQKLYYIRDIIFYGTVTVYL